MPDAEDTPTRGRPRKFNKADVTDVAMHAYWAAGPTEVSLNAICKRAGVSKPSVYREFGNEDGLTCAALERYAQSVLANLMAITASDDGFASKISQLAFSFVEDKLHEDGCLFVKMRAAKEQMGPKTQDLITQLDQMALEAFAKLLAEGRASGEWTGRIPIELGARYLHAQIGLALDQRARGEDPKDILALALSVLGHTRT